MGNNMIAQLMDLGSISVLALSAFGSAFGAGMAGMSAIGAWKKNFAQNKSAPFLLVALVAAPLTQTIYGFIVMNRMVGIAIKGNYLWSLGLFAGAAIGLSAYWQGKSAAAACDAMGETGKGFGNYIAVLGIIETVALFVMVFAFVLLDKFAGL